MENSKKEPTSKVFADDLILIDECPKGSIMDRINRRCNGEELPPMEEEKEDSKKK